MASEIQYVGAAGLTLTAKLMLGTAQVGADIALTATSVTTFYTGSVPGGTGAGLYSVLILSGSTVVGAGQLRWDGTAEVLPATVAAVSALQTSATAIKTQTDKMTFTVAGVQDVNVLLVGGTVQTARDLGASVLLSPGTGAGQISLTAGRVTANADQLAGQTVTAAAGVTFPATVASPTNITAGTVTTVTNLTNAPTAGDFTAVMKASITTAATAATPTVTTSDSSGVTTLLSRVTGAPLLATNYTPPPSAASIAAAVAAPSATDIAAVVAAPSASAIAVAVAAPSAATIAAAVAAPSAAANAAAVWAYVVRTLTSGGGGGGGSTPADNAAYLLASVAGDGTVQAAFAKLNAVPGPGPVLVLPGAPADSDVCRVYGYFETLDNLPAANLRIAFRLRSSTTNAVLSEKVVTALNSVEATTDSQGRLVSGSKLYIDLIRNDDMLPADTEYEVSIAGVLTVTKRIKLTTSMLDLRSIL